MRVVNVVGDFNQFFETIYTFHNTCFNISIFKTNICATHKRIVHLSLKRNIFQLKNIILYIIKHTQCLVKTPIMM